MGAHIRSNARAINATASTTPATIAGRPRTGTPMPPRRTAPEAARAPQGWAAFTVGRPSATGVAPNAPGARLVADAGTVPLPGSVTPQACADMLIALRVEAFDYYGPGDEAKEARDRDLATTLFEQARYEVSTSDGAQLYAVHKPRNTLLGTVDDPVTLVFRAGVLDEIRLSGRTFSAL